MAFSGEDFVQRLFTGDKELSIVQGSTQPQSERGNKDLGMIMLAHLALD